MPSVSLTQGCARLEDIMRAQERNPGTVIRKTCRNTQVYAWKLQVSCLGILEPQSCTSSPLDVKYSSVLQSLVLLPIVASLPHFVWVLHCCKGRQVVCSTPGQVQSQLHYAINWWQNPPEIRSARLKMNLQASYQEFKCFAICMSPTIKITFLNCIMIIYIMLLKKILVI